MLCARRTRSPHRIEPSLTALPAPLLSIIIPAHNEESRLPHSLEQVFAFLEKQGYPSEVVVVENGSTDRKSDRSHVVL